MGVAVGTIVGGWLGALLSHGNWFSGLSIVGTVVGAFVGIWVGYKLSQNM
jgi:uncharacterized membrane protein YeaQ/YmgE (transglycosylase-associated protein family)